MVVPRNPREAKGLLLACIRDPNPCIFFEPKAMYRTSSGEVPVGDYTIELGKADMVQEGTDVTVVGWGAQMRVLQVLFILVALFCFFLCECVYALNNFLMASKFLSTSGR